MTPRECVTPRARRPCETPWSVNPAESPCGDRPTWIANIRREPEPRVTRADRARWRAELLASRCFSLALARCASRQNHRALVAPKGQRR